jgi:ABC-type multidrug transport system permease subunit
MRHLKNIWLMTLKDLRLFARDRRALFFFIAFPFLFIVIFNFVLSGVGSEDSRLTLHMVTREPAGSLSYTIIGALETKDVSQLQPGAPIIVWDKDYATDYTAVEDGDMTGFIAFPADFTQSLMGGKHTQLEIVTNAKSDNDRAALEGLADAISSKIDAQWVGATATIELLVEQGLISPTDNTAIQQVVNQFISGPGVTAPGQSSVGILTQEIGDVKKENAANYVIPGYLVMFVFFSAALWGSLSLIRERENNTLERLLATSVRRFDILGGEFLGNAAKGLIQIAIFWIVGIYAFNIDLGVAPWAVILLSILMVLMSAAFGIMLATLVRTEGSARSIAILVSLALAPLGGCWWPLFITPKAMQFIAKLTPHGWANTGFDKLMVFGANFSAAVPSMLALIGFAALFGIIAIWRFRTSAEAK